MRNRVANALLAMVLGGVLGYIALILRELGWAIAAGATGLLALFYATHGRRIDIGWLLVGLGTVPTLILGRNGLAALVDPSIDVGPDTWAMLAVAVSIGVTGGLVIYALGPGSRSERN